MPKKSHHKVNKTFSFDYHFAMWLEDYSIRNDKSMSLLIQENMTQKYPEITQYKTKVQRRIV